MQLNGLGGFKRYNQDTLKYFLLLMLQSWSSKWGDGMLIKQQWKIWADFNKNQQVKLWSSLINRNWILADSDNLPCWPLKLISVTEQRNKERMQYSKNVQYYFMIFQIPLANHISSNEFPFSVHTTGFKQHRNFEVVGDLLA